MHTPLLGVCVLGQRGRGCNSSQTRTASGTHCCLLNHSEPQGFKRCMVHHFSCDYQLCACSSAGFTCAALISWRFSQLGRPGRHRWQVWLEVLALGWSHPCVLHVTSHPQRGWGPFSLSCIRAANRASQGPLKLRAWKL